MASVPSEISVKGSPKKKFKKSSVDDKWKDELSKPSTSRHTPQMSFNGHSIDVDQCILEAEPSKKFTNSTLRLSTSNILGATPSPKGRKKLKKLSVEVSSPCIPLNDDCNELIEEEEKTGQEQEKSLNSASKPPEEEQEISIVKTMTIDEMQEHVSRCLQLSTENKINTKNAFALKLIDCMTIITKNEDNSNFAAMACQLDAGAKIYSHRVDAVYQQVIKLVETCMYAEKKSKKQKDGTEDPNTNSSDEELAGTSDEKVKEKKKKAKKKVLASEDQISRKPKDNDPRDQFVRLDALPGDILDKAKRDPKDLSLTLDRHTQFWMDWQNYKVTTAEGSSEICNIVQKNRIVGPELKIDLEADLSSIPKLEPLLPLISQDDDPKAEESDLDDDFGDEFENIDADASIKIDSDMTKEESTKKDDVEIVSLAKSRMTTNGSMVPSRLEVINALFHRPGESEYHYLKMNNSYYWAGPSYWKRPHGVNLAENKKRATRKKKDPAAIEYTEEAVHKSLKSKKESTSNIILKRSTFLSKRTLSKWNKKKVTYPPDIHFKPETFHLLFHIDVVADVIHDETLNKKQTDEPPSDTDLSTVDNDDLETAANFDFADAANDDSPNAGGSKYGETSKLLDGSEPSPAPSLLNDPEFCGFRSPCPPKEGFEGLMDILSAREGGWDSGASSPELDRSLGFRGFPSSQSTENVCVSGRSSPFDTTDPSSGFPGFPTTGGTDDPTPSTSTEAGHPGPSSSSCDVYEGDNLVPMVKTVKVNPIRCVARPNRVDMQHLKDVMLGIIRCGIEDRENQLRDQGVNNPCGAIFFRDVLTKLFNTDELHHRTQQDLTVPMAFLCLLTLTNENSFNLCRDENENDILIKYYQEEKKGDGKRENTESD